MTVPALKPLAEFLTHAAMTARILELEAALRLTVTELERLDPTEGVCCCGSPMDHAFDNHSPVDAGVYHHGLVVEEAKKVLSNG